MLDLAKKGLKSRAMGGGGVNGGGLVQPGFQIMMQKEMLSECICSL